jgi:hypothetical protein
MRQRPNQRVWGERSQTQTLSLNHQSRNMLTCHSHSQSKHYWFYLCLQNVSGKKRRWDEVVRASCAH